MPRQLVLVGVSAGLLALPFHFGELYGLAFFAFLPYFFAIRDQSAGDVFKYSYLFGIGFFLLLGFWLVYVSVLGFILMVLYLGLYFALFGAASGYFLNTAPLGMRTAIFLPAFWVVAEWLRGWLILGGCPWALLGYTQWKNIPVIQIADMGGAYFVSFFVLLVNVAFYVMIRRRARPFLVFFVFAWTLVLGYGFWRIGSLEPRQGTFKISVIQGNIPQEKKWDKRIKSIIFEKYKHLTLMAAEERPDLIVWPETSFPGYLEDEPLLSVHLRALVRAARTELLVGAPTFGSMAQGLKFFNSAIFYGSNGEEKARYNKVHLVPFGEYVPLESVIGFIRRFVAIGRFSPGQTQTVLTTAKKYKFGVLICYEDTFPSLVRNLAGKGVDFVVNITNDAWFGKTTAPYQHAQASVFRAVENRIPVVRAANTGLSCFITPEGKILSSVQDQGEEIFVTGYKTQDIYFVKAKTLYTLFGDVFVYLCIGLSALAFRDKSLSTPYTRV